MSFMHVKIAPDSRSLNNKIVGHSKYCSACGRLQIPIQTAQLFSHAPSVSPAIKHFTGVTLPLLCKLLHPLEIQTIYCIALFETSLFALFETSLPCLKQGKIINIPHELLMLSISLESQSAGLIIFCFDLI